MRQIIFSRTFPTYHKRFGEPTFFVEKMLYSLIIQHKGNTDLLNQPDFDTSVFNRPEFMLKHHTIRSGERWEKGMYFAPKYWSGRPYNSKCVQFAPYVVIEKTYNFKINEKNQIFINQILCRDETALAQNDGLCLEDFNSWFQRPLSCFSGQIICWSNEVQY